MDLDALFGQRVSLRHRIGERDGRPLYSDAVGELVPDGDALTVHARRGPVRVERAAVVAVRAVPPAPPRRASLTAVVRLEGLCADAWPAQVQEMLGDWRLRAAGGYTARANTALAVGSPGVPVPAALDVVREFAARHGIEWWLQPKGPETAHPLDGTASALAYRLPEFGLVMPFRPTDFTQVNHQINEALVSRALRLLAPAADEFVIDWFCGLGNFTLPLATFAGRVLGIEGSAALLERAGAAAALNGLAAKTSFAARNLFEVTADDLIALGSAAKWLIDPPREGAFAIAKALADLCDADRSAALGASWRPPQRIVYVSCNPATLARDAGLFVHRAGYRCSAAGIINMFPHTAHVESIAVFDRDEGDR